MNIKDFTRGYITAALWSSTGDDGEPLDAIHAPEDLPQETRATMESDCRKFFEQCNDDLWEYKDKRAIPIDAEFTVADCAGHDFWLTRCGHGAGFWDRGLGELGERLTVAAEKFGNGELYTGDDGKIYQL
mgnify:FL=1